MQQGPCMTILFGMRKAHRKLFIIWLRKGLGIMLSVCEEAWQGLSKVFNNLLQFSLSKASAKLPWTAWQGS